MPTPMATKAAIVMSTVGASTPFAKRSARWGAASTMRAVMAAPPTMYGDRWRPRIGRWSDRWPMARAAEIGRASCRDRVGGGEGEGGVGEQAPEECGGR